jgi:hypothetical protein
MSNKRKECQVKKVNQGAAEDLVQVLSAKYPQHSFSHDGTHIYLSYDATTVSIKDEFVLVTDLFVDEYGTLSVEPALYYGIKEVDARKFNAFNRLPFPCDMVMP